MNRLPKEKILAAQAGDHEKLEEILELFYRYGMEVVVRLGIKPSEREDAIQTGVIYVAAAIKRYDSNRYMKPVNYLFMALKAGINTYLRGMGFQKNRIVSDALRLDSAVSPDAKQTWTEIIEDPNAKVEKNVVGSMFFEEFYQGLEQLLSPVEQGVLALRRRGMAPKEISKVLNIKQKAEDNAWYRIRKKAAMLG
ncbi:sigma-70 family RNA polymerase sigma factor [Anaerospora sp.]|uniref:sigma-70 family RNA polymerase sigma factor n=1 Tax=Anaerospora sp. TaxID=1960278 RepID=UPI00289AD362|nr:sigma-70 family RNA polymerase sigma factor [Anaerospora sp.]